MKTNDHAKSRLHDRSQSIHAGRLTLMSVKCKSIILLNNLCKATLLAQVASMKLSGSTKYSPINAITLAKTAINLFEKTKKNVTHYA